MKRRWKYLKKQLRRPLVAVPVFAFLILIIGAGAYATIGGSSPVATNPVNLQKGLVGWWRMNGNVKDSTPYANNGVNSGATPTIDRKGLANGAYSFNGTSNYVTAAPVSLAKFTVGAWIKPNGLQTDSASVVSDTYPTKVNYAIFFNPGSLQVHGGIYLGGWYYTPIATLADGVWAHIVFTYDGNTMTLYVNGNTIGTTAYVASPSSSGTAFNIGRRWDLPNYFNGSISDVRLYNRAISAAEVVALYGQYNPAVKADSGGNGLIGQWKFNGNYRDATPLANNLTVNGTTLVADRKGRTSSALSSNGTSDYVYGKIGNGTYFGGNSPLSVSAWVYVTATSSGPIFGVTTAPPGGGWNMPFLSLNGTTIYGWIYNNTPIITTVAANQWHYIALTYSPPNSPSTILYIDGRQVGTAIGAYAGSGGVDYFTTYISGVKPAAGVANYLNTPISDVRAYSRTLSASEIAAQYSNYNSQLSIGGSGAPGSVSLGKGLVGDWALNGGAKDATPYGYNGTVTSATLTTDRKGRANSAYSFSGISGQGIFLPTSGKYTTFGTTSYTVGAWIKTTDAGGQKCIMSTAGGSQGFRFGYTGGLPYFLVGDGPHYQEGGIGTTTLNDGKWHFLAITYTYSANWSVTAYIDGAQTGSINLPATIGSVNDTSAVIGSIGGGAVGMVIGSVDDVRVYNRVLSGAEIMGLYASYR